MDVHYLHHSSSTSISGSGYTDRRTFFISAGILFLVFLSVIAINTLLSAPKGAQPGLLSFEYSYKMGKPEDLPETFDLSGRAVNRQTDVFGNPVSKGGNLEQREKNRRMGEAGPNDTNPSSLQQKTKGNQVSNNKNKYKTNGGMNKGQKSDSQLSNSYTPPRSTNSGLGSSPYATVNSPILVAGVSAAVAGEDSSERGGSGSGEGKNKTMAEWEALIVRSLASSSQLRAVALEFAKACEEGKVSDSVMRTLLSTQLKDADDNKRKFALLALENIHSRASFELLVQYRAQQVEGSQDWTKLSQILNDEYVNSGTTFIMLISFLNALSRNKSPLDIQGVTAALDLIDVALKSQQEVWLALEGSKSSQAGLVDGKKTTSLWRKEIWNSTQRSLKILESDSAFISRNPEVKTRVDLLLTDLTQWLERAYSS